MIELEEKAVPIIVDIEGGKISANIESADNICVTLGESAALDVTAAVNYIKSGEAELRPLVDETKGYKNEAQASAQRAESAAATFVPDKTFVFEQGISSDTWQITHNLDKHPSVTVVDTADNVIYPAVQYIDNNSCVVTFNAATKGKAYLN